MLARKILVLFGLVLAVQFAACKTSHSINTTLDDRPTANAADALSDEQLKRDLELQANAARPEGIDDDLWEDLKKEQVGRLDILTKLEAAEMNAVEWFGEDNLLSKEIINAVRKQYAGRPGAARNIVVIGWPGQAKTLIVKKLAEWLEMGDRFKIVSLADGTTALPAEFVISNLVNAQKRFSVLPILYAIDEAQRRLQMVSNYNRETERAKLIERFVKPTRDALPNPAPTEYNALNQYNNQLKMIEAAVKDIEKTLDAIEAEIKSAKESEGNTIQILRDIASADGTVEPIGGGVAGKKATAYLEEIRQVIQHYKDYDLLNDISADRAGHVENGWKAKAKAAEKKLADLANQQQTTRNTIAEKSGSSDEADLKAIEIAGSLLQKLEAEYASVRNEQVHASRFLEAQESILKKAQSIIAEALAIYPELFSNSEFENLVPEEGGWKISSRYIWLTRIFEKDPQKTYEALKPIAEKLETVDRRYGGHITTVEILNPIEIMAKVTSLAGPGASKDRIHQVAKDYLASEEGKIAIEKQLKNLFGEKDWDSFRKRLLEIIILPETQAQMEATLKRILSKNASEIIARVGTQTKITYTDNALNIFFQIGMQKPDPRAAVMTIESSLMKIFDSIEKDILERKKSRQSAPEQYDIDFNMDTATLSAHSVTGGQGTLVATYVMAQVVEQAKRIADQNNYKMSEAEVFLKASRMVSMAYVGQLLKGKRPGKFGFIDAEGLVLLRNHFYQPPDIGRDGERKKRSWQYELDELLMLATGVESDNMRFLDLTSQGDNLLAELKVRIPELMALLKKSAAANGLTGPNAVAAMMQRAGIPDNEAYHTIIDGARGVINTDQVAERLRNYSRTILEPLMASNVTSAKDALANGHRVIDVLTERFLRHPQMEMDEASMEEGVVQVILEEAKARLMGLGFETSLSFKPGGFESFLSLSRSRRDPRASTDVMKSLVDSFVAQIEQDIAKPRPENQPKPPRYEVAIGAGNVDIAAVHADGRKEPISGKLDVQTTANEVNRRVNNTDNDILLKASRLNCMNLIGGLTLQALANKVSIDDEPGRELIERKMWPYPSVGRNEDGTPKRSVEYDIYELLILAAGVESDVVQIADLDAGGIKLLAELRIAAVDAVESIMAAAEKTGMRGENAVADYITQRLDPGLMKNKLFQIIAQTAKSMANGPGNGKRLDPKNPEDMKDPRLGQVEGLVSFIRNAANGIIRTHMVGNAPNFWNMIRNNQSKVIDALNEELVKKNEISPESTNAILASRFRRSLFGIIKLPTWGHGHELVFSTAEAGGFNASNCRILQKGQLSREFRRWASQFNGVL